MRSLARFRPSPALVVATVALLASLAGTGVAAVALAPRNSVGSEQVIDGSLKSKDFRAGQIPAGSEAYSRSVASVVLKIGDHNLPVTTLSIPRPGTYVIWAIAHLAVNDTGAECKLIADGSTDTNSASFPAQAAGAPSNATLSHLIVHEFSTTGRVELECGSYSKGKVVRVTDVTVTAIKVTSPTSS